MYYVSMLIYFCACSHVKIHIFCPWQIVNCPHSLYQIVYLFPLFLQARNIFMLCIWVYCFLSLHMNLTISHSFNFYNTYSSVGLHFSKSSAPDPPLWFFSSKVSCCVFFLLLFSTLAFEFQNWFLKIHYKYWNFHSYGLYFSEWIKFTPLQSLSLPVSNLVHFPSIQGFFLFIHNVIQILYKALTHLFFKLHYSFCCHYCKEVSFPIMFSYWNYCVQ